MNIFVKICFVLYMLHIFGCSNGITLDSNGGYHVTIGINPDLAEPRAPTQFINNLKTLWNMVSKKLYIATRKKVFFKKVRILIPESWKLQSLLDPFVIYSKTKIIVDNPNKARPDPLEPYTLHFGKCKEEGEYLHISDELLLKFDSLTTEEQEAFAQIAVTSWAQLRWGVFPEYPTGNYPKFYYDGRHLKPSSCSLGIKGSRKDPTDITNECVRDNTGYPPKICIFVPDKKIPPVNSRIVSTSIMSHPKHPQMTTFCDEWHNTLAHNEHNDFCNRESTWDVILESDDIKGKTFPGNLHITDLTPVFEIIRSVKDRTFVLVLDKSASMSILVNGTETRFDAMLNMLYTFIDTLCPLGTSVGTVWFDTSTDVWQNITELTSKSVRQNVITDLKANPLTPSHGTNIELGIENAINMLKKHGATKGTHILVLTDGIQNNDWQHLVDQDVKDRGHILHAIFFGVAQGNPFLQQLVEDTKGQWSLAKDYLGMVNQIQNIFKTLETNLVNIAVKSTTIALKQGVFTFFDVLTILDSSAGRNPRFDISYNANHPPNVVIYDPTTQHAGCIRGYPPPTGYQCDISITVKTTFKRITFDFLGYYRNRVMVTRIQKNTQDLSDSEVNLIVTAQPDPSVKPILVRSGVRVVTLNNRVVPLIWARVSQGYEPVIGATMVEATVTDGSGQKLPVVLKDNGADPDVRKDDGVYSGYMYQPKMTGRFAVTVEVKGPKSGKSVSGKRQISNGSPSFERTAYVGGFEYTGPPEDPTADLSPPARISDFSVILLNIDDFSEGFRFKFTAVGDDITDGNASRYEVRFADVENMETLLSNFNSFPEIPFNLLSSPQPAGTVENMDVKFNLTKHGIINATEDVNRIAFVIRAVDDEGKYGDVSNLAQVDVFIVSPKKLYEQDEKARNAAIISNPASPAPAGPDIPTTIVTDILKENKEESGSNVVVIAVVSSFALTLLITLITLITDVVIILLF